MHSKSTHFFATELDLNVITDIVRETHSVDFVEMGLFPTPDIVVLEPTSRLQSSASYLVIERGNLVKLRAVPQRSGGLLYAVDQLENQHSITLATGGIVGDGHLIAGQVGTVATNKKSIDLYATFSSAIRKRFEKIKSYYVGPIAAEMLDKGARLSGSSRAPSIYDLVRK